MDLLGWSQVQEVLVMVVWMVELPLLPPEPSFHIPRGDGRW